jgi:hypothetical protein
MSGAMARNVERLAIFTRLSPPRMTMSNEPPSSAAAVELDLVGIASTRERKPSTKFWTSSAIPCASCR